LHKNTKIWLNYTVGGAISFFLLWSIYGQVMKQYTSMPNWELTGNAWFLVLCVGLMFTNTSLEGYKWFLLSRTVGPVAYSRAFSSYLAGVAFSIITPNRVGEYPGRILYLGKGNTFRYINVSVLGVISQLSAVYIFGLAGLIYYNFFMPQGMAIATTQGLFGYYVPKVALVACLVVNILMIAAYWRFEDLLAVLGRVSWLSKFVTYARLLQRVGIRQQLLVLGISLLRFGIFTAQFLLLLKYMNVDVPMVACFCLASLFFWIMAVIPSIALTELGIRGKVSLFLFSPFSSNVMGILAASVGLWLLNLIIPSIIGSILIIRMKILR